MQAPPAVSLLLGTGRAWRVAGVLFVTLALMAVVAWSRAHGGLAWIVVPLTAGLGAWCLLPLWRPARRVRWDGQQWWLGDRAGTARLALDFDDHLLLGFAPAESRRSDWLAVSRRASDGDWLALRRALYWPRPALAVPADSDPTV